MEWLDHLVPLQVLRVLWDALFPSRFERLVVDGMDGSPTEGYAKPLTFSVGCWLILFAVAQAFPWAFATSGVGPVLTSLPAADRHAVAAKLGITRIPGVVIPDTGHVSLGRATVPAASVIRQRAGKRVGRVTAADVAGVLENEGDTELALHVRGYAARSAERPTPFDQTTLVVFVVFGLVPGWWASHRILASPMRTLPETRRVHMYNDGWFVVSCLVPLSIATYSGEAFASRWPQRVLAFVGLVAALTWLVRTLHLYRRTHDAPMWRVVLAHAVGLSIALTMGTVFALAVIVLRDMVHRAGF